MNFPAFELLWKTHLNGGGWKFTDLSSWALKKDGAKGQLMLVDILGGGLKYLLFSPLFGEDSHFD